MTETASPAIPATANPAIPATDCAPAVGPVPARATTASQRARRRRILHAAVALARQGGYDAVQMREVAELAGVALGTLYRYFPSKVHLLSAAMVGQLEALRDQLLCEKAEGEDAYERVVAVMNRLVGALERDRLVTDALVRAMIVAPQTEIEQINAVNAAIISTAKRGCSVSEVGESDYRLSLLIGKVLMTDLISWLCDRMTMEQVKASLSDMVAVSLVGQPALTPSTVLLPAP